MRTEKQIILLFDSQKQPPRDVCPPGQLLLINARSHSILTQIRLVLTVAVTQFLSKKPCELKTLY